MTSLHGRTILIIGATGGIGAAFTEQCANEGAQLSLFSRNPEKLSGLRERFPGAITTEGDALSFPDLQRAVTETVSAFGRIDVLVHAVGSILLRPLHQTSEEQFRQTLDMNLTSPFLAMKAVLPDMLSRNDGAIILCSSVAGGTGLRNHEAVSAAKGGLEAMVRSAAMTYARQNIRINAVAFGLVDTPLAASITRNETARAASAAMHPAGRIGTPQDVTAALRYFASPESAWTTGQILHVDGGMSAGK
ncbi:MAG: SDR family oxidoreductase [Bacteroidetes bacterium]|nr:SDR family oxidoreductase [Bacteroidota bacterium]